MQQWHRIEEHNCSRKVHYPTQLGLYTMVGCWYALSGPCGAGGAIGGGVVSCRRRPVCCGESRLCGPSFEELRVVGDPFVATALW